MAADGTVALSSSGTPSDQLPHAPGIPAIVPPCLGSGLLLFITSHSAPVTLLPRSLPHPLALSHSLVDALVLTPTGLPPPTSLPELLTLWCPPPRPIPQLLEKGECWIVFFNLHLQGAGGASQEVCDE